MSKNGMKTKAVTVDHTKQDIRDACGITKERAEILDDMFEPEAWMQGSEVSSSRCAEEIATLSLNEATYVIAKTLNMLWNVHPKYLERRMVGTKAILFMLTDADEIMAVKCAEEYERVKRPDTDKDTANQIAWRTIFRQGIAQGIENGNEIMKKLKYAIETGDPSNLTLAEVQELQNLRKFIDSKLNEHDRGDENGGA